MRIVSPTGKKLKFNSRTVEYETPFLFLNNCDNMSDDGLLIKSEIDLTLLIK